MAPETLAKSTLTRTLADVLGHFSDLVAKQIQLARAEITANISSGLLASIWLVVATLLFLLAGVLVIQAATTSQILASRPLLILAVISARANWICLATRSEKWPSTSASVRVSVDFARVSGAIGPSAWGSSVASRVRPGRGPGQ